MVRSQSHKLLSFANPEQNLFFDLNKDPYEFDNRIKDNDNQPELLSLREEMLNWALYTTRSSTYLDYSAPVITGENIPAQGNNHVQLATEYFKAQMHTPFDSVQ